jgi:hypothetical protein
VAYRSQLGKKMDIYETWFRYLEDGVMKSGVVWTDTTLQHVFDKSPNPNWNYDDEEDFVGNLFAEPMPPLIPINYLNDGSSYFDQTSLIEQSAQLQYILDKRGFQIMENADQAGGGLVFNTTMITKKEMAALVGSPDERIGVKGNVNEAIARVGPPPLPNYVMEDKQDARNEIDNIFSTHAPLRGEGSGNKTLGQDAMQQRGDLTRMDDVARAIERMARNYFRYLFQMMKVYYTEEHYFMSNGESGRFDQVVMHRDRIEEGVSIRISQGSMRPPDRVSQQKWVSDLVNQGMIDPLTVYEVAKGGDLPSAEKMLERYMLYKLDPMTYMGKTKEDEVSREAVADIAVLNRGEMPKIRNEYPPTYLNFLIKYMIGGEYSTLPMQVQIMYVQHMRIVQGMMAQQMSRMMTQMPNQDEMDAQNQKAAQQQALAGQINPPAPEPAAGAAGGPSGPPVAPTASDASNLANRMAATASDQ